MTLAEKMGRHLPTQMTGTACRPDDHHDASAEAANEEVVVFRRDPKTGVYDKFVACCEGILPPTAYA